MKTILVDAADTLTVKNEDEKFIVFQPLLELLESFSNPKIVVTNANDEELITYGIDKVPYEVFTLKHEPNKTDPTFFKKLMDQYELTAEDIVYFEHTPTAVESAQSLGITSYYYDDSKRDLNALKKFLQENL